MITEILAIVLLRNAGNNLNAGVDALSAVRVPVPKAPRDTVVGREAAAVPKKVTKLPSQLPNVSDAAWTSFCRAMRTQELGDVSPSNALGMFEMKPRRLGDLGLVKNLSSTRTDSGRMVWVGEFVSPMSSKKFLGSPVAQYNAFAESMKDYERAVRGKELHRGMTLSGALAVLHRGGPGALKSWGNEGGRFEETEALYERVNGIF